MQTQIKKTLVVIPARGGSKRIHNKNIIDINGQPMIYWPLIQLSTIFKGSDVLVSTDSSEIKSAVEKKGLQVPFLRPAELSDDYTGTAEVVAHALNWYEDHVCKVEYVMTVYPTAVLLSAADIVAAVEALRSDRNCDSIMSATSFPFPIQRAVFENSAGYAEMFEPSHYSSRSQDLTEAMHDAGQFYVSKASVVREGRVLTNTNVKLHKLARNKVVDIDTFEDFQIAEERLRLMRGDQVLDNWRFVL